MTNTTTGDIKFFYTELDKADITVSGSDLIRDAGLETAVTLILGTNRRASDNDILPTPTSDPGGWWADKVLFGSDFGTKLWLLGRSSITDSVLNDAAGYVKEGLEDLVKDGIISSVTVAAAKSQTKVNTVNFSIQLTRKQKLSLKFRFSWNFSQQIFGG